MFIAKKLRSEKQRKDPLFIIVVSIIICSILVVYPMSYVFAGWRPVYMFMIMLFWVLCQPTWCGVWFASKPTAATIFAEPLWRIATTVGSFNIMPFPGA